MKVGDRKIYMNENQFKTLLLIKEGLNGFDYDYAHSNIVSHLGYFKDTIFIQYGSDIYKKGKEAELCLDYDAAMVCDYNKPQGGLWASPLNSTNSWGDYLDRASFRLKSLAKHYKFKISNKSKIYVIDNCQDLYAISTKNSYASGGALTIDFNRLVKSSYGCDGIYITSKASRLFHLYSIDIDNKGNWMRGLDSWDVESICIFNPDIIEPIEEDIFDKAKLPKKGLHIDYRDGYLSKDSIRDREWLQMQSDYERYGNQNIRSDMGELFKGGKHPAILAQGHGNSKGTKLARRFNGTIKSGL